MRSEFRKQYGSKLLALFVVIIMITVVYPVLITNAKNPSQLSAYDNDWNDISDFSNDLNKDGSGTHEIKTIVSRPAIINKISEIEKNSTDPTIRNNDTILVIIGVERMYTEFDSGAIHEFVKNGGKVVLADDSGYGNSAFYGEMGSLEIGMKLRTNIVQEGCAPQKSDSLTGNVDDIILQGADGLKIERPNENTILFRNAPTATQYTDDMAKDAAATALVNGNHNNITVTYDSTSKVFNLTGHTGAGGGGTTKV